jgi:hypothetical protein
VTSFANPWLAYIRLSGGASVELLPDCLYVQRAVEIGMLARQLALMIKGSAVKISGSSDVSTFRFGGDPLDAPIRRLA